MPDHRAKQNAVLRSMALALILCLLVLILALFADPFGTLGYTLLERVSVAATCLIAPILAMLGAIGLSAGQRFFSAPDIDAAARPEESPQMRMAAAITRNTMEQSLLAALVYIFAAIHLPSYFLDAIPLSAILFMVGRMLFVRGYARGAAGRALGFELSFGSTLTLFLVSAWAAYFVVY